MGDRLNSGNKLNTTKNGKSKKKIFTKKLIIPICIGAVIGFIIGILGVTLLFDSTKSRIEEMTFLSLILTMYGFLFMFVVFYFLHIIIHEAGHLIFGIITGYRFVSFRIGSTAFIMENGKLQKRKFNIPGTAGQCLLAPPKLVEGNYPYVIYNLGGVIINLVSSVLAILILFLIPEKTGLLSIFIFLFAGAGILTGLMNGIPLKLSGVPNDGYNVISMLRSDEGRKAFYFLLEVNDLQSKGIRLKDIPAEKFVIFKDMDLTNVLVVSAKLLECSRYLDNQDFESARTCLDEFKPMEHKLPKIAQISIKCEKLFLELIGDCNQDMIEELYDLEVEQYIKAGKYMMNTKRLKYAYEALYHHDTQLMLKSYGEACKLVQNYPVRGEAEQEMMLIHYVKKLASGG